MASDQAHHHHKIARSSIIPLICFTTVWIISSVGQVVLVKYFQTVLHPQLPWLLADLAGVGFVFVIPIYLAFCIKRVKYEQEKEENPSTLMDLFMAPYRTGRIKWHILGGLFTGCQLLCISFALKMLPGSTFTVVRTCELLITLVSSIVLLGKVFNRYHYVAIASMLIGGAIDSFATQHDDKVSKKDVHVFAGVLITFFGVALASSSQAVLVEWLYQHNIMVKKRYDHLMEISLYTTFYTCVALLLGTFLFSGDEPQYWFQALKDAIQAAPFTTWVCLIGLTMSRAVAMTSKVGVTVHSDAMFNRSLTTVRRVCQITFMAVLFHEHLSALAIFGIFLSVAASTLYAFAATLGARMAPIVDTKSNGVAPLLQESLLPAKTA
ncbi:hypothetical protein FOL47_006220 [Perkinsus chesapeaki]|uniref:Uncharacterized protein n=1 Tax=Perkinsus chesapeaki TaxID=330153 RepID=A0A7J6LT39_PERCH|nr:hypothetical protein FOL47_006220 [Perkinsus chesapeaki]